MEKQFQAEIVTTISIHEMFLDEMYTGRLEDFTEQPIDFTILFNFPVSRVESMVRGGEALQMPTPLLAAITNEAVGDKFTLSFEKNGEKLPEDLQEPLGDTLLTPILFAYSLLRRDRKQNGKYNIPVLCAEEMHQFNHPTELQEFIEILNP